MQNLESRIPAGWKHLTEDEKSFLENELEKELCDTHELFRLNLKVAASKEMRDDFLFIQADESKSIEECKCYVVHLTWSKETNPNWPVSTPFLNFADFLENWYVELYGWPD